MTDQPPKLNQPPRKRDGDYDPQELDRWYQSIWGLLGKLAGIPWGSVSKIGSKLSDIETRPHEMLQDVGVNTHPQIDTALTRLANTSGTNTGDETTATIEAKIGTLPVIYGGTGTATGSITGTGALTFAAGAGNNSITLAPTGTGEIDLNGFIRSGKGMYLTSASGSNTFQLNNLGWAVILGSSPTQVQFNGNVVGNLTISADVSLQLRSATTTTIQAGAGTLQMGSTAGFAVTDELGANIVTLTSAGLDVAAPYIQLNGVPVILMKGNTCPVYANNAAAITGGLGVGDLYQTSTGVMMVRY